MGKDIDYEQIRKALKNLPRQKKLLLVRAMLEWNIRNSDPYRAYRDRYRHDPVLWINEFVEVPLVKHQMKVFEAIRDGWRKVAIYGPHGLGKSALAAVLIFWAGSTAIDTKVVTTASVWRQLEKYLWPEVHKWEDRINWNNIGTRPELLKLSATFGPTAEAFAVASNHSSSIEGAHASRVVYIFDEAKTIPIATWDSAEGAFSTPGDHLQIALSTPGEPSGRFYEICSHQHGYEEWKVISVNASDSIRSGRMGLEWAKKRRRAWGITSAAYRQRVWGQFVKESDDAIIPLAWVEAANQRWHAWNDAGGKLGPLDMIGVDCAGMGRDKTVFAPLHGKVITGLLRFEKQTPMTIVGNLKPLMGKEAHANIDVIGEGAGVVARLIESTEHIDRTHAIHAAKKTDRVDRTEMFEFANVRAAMWWNAREMLDPQYEENICLPPDHKLTGDLTAPRRKTRSDGKMLIEPKDDIKARIGRSTDDGDAVVQALYTSELTGDYVVMLENEYVNG